MLSLKISFALLMCVLCTVQAAPQGVVGAGLLSQQVRLPNLDSAHIQVQRLGGNFAYTVADSGPVHGLVHYAAVPSVQYVPVAPVGVVGQQPAQPILG